MAKPREASKNVNNRGMVLLNTTEFSAASTISINNVFTSSYDHYKVLITSQTASSVGSGLRLRASGSDATSGYAINYTAQNSDNRHGVNGAATQFEMQYDNSGSYRFFVIEFLNPYLAENTFFSCTGWYDNVLMLTNGVKQDSLQYDGFTYRPNSGNFSAVGQIKVYGYNNEVQ